LCIHQSGPSYERIHWIVWNGRRVIIAYDADAVSEETVRIARSALAAHLRSA
jgi:hypothetical protein